jgi:hypothetical protein
MDSCIDTVPELSVRLKSPFLSRLRQSPPGADVAMDTMRNRVEISSASNTGW